MTQLGGGLQNCSSAEERLSAPGCPVGTVQGAACLPDGEAGGSKALCILVSRKVFIAFCL